MMANAANTALQISLDAAGLYLRTLLPWAPPMQTALPRRRGWGFAENIAAAAGERNGAPWTRG